MSDSKTKSFVFGKNILFFRILFWKQMLLKARECTTFSRWLCVKRNILINSLEKGVHIYTNIIKIERKTQTQKKREILNKEREKKRSFTRSLCFLVCVQTEKMYFHKRVFGLHLQLLVSTNTFSSLAIQHSTVHRFVLWKIQNTRSRTVSIQNIIDVQKHIFIVIVATRVFLSLNFYSECELAQAHSSFCSVRWNCLLKKYSCHYYLRCVLLS